MESLALSVIISTYNRQEYLKSALDSLVAQQCSPSSFDVIVVDNNSSDQTPNLVAQYMQLSLPRITYYNETRQGMCYARNRGAHEASGDIIVFLDDDAIADRLWAARLMDVYAAFPDAGVVGGRIQAVWPGKKPGWITPDLELCLGGDLNYGAEVRRLTYPQTPFGGNFSIRRDLFLSLGGFDANLGRSGSGLLGCEEVDLCCQVTQQKKSIYFSPFAIVHHRVMPEKLGKPYIIKRAYYQGVSVAASERRYGGGQPGASGQYLWHMKNIFKNLVRHCLTGQSHLWVEDLFYFFLNMGRLKETVAPSVCLEKRKLPTAEEG